MFSLANTVVLTVAVLAGVASPAYSDIGITTQNVRVTLGPAHARHDIRQAAGAGSVVFTQEMYWRHARRFAPAGWGTAHVRRGYRGDCATFWDRDRWHLRRAYVVRLVDRRTPAHPSNGHRWALVAVLTGAQTWAGVCVHLPTKRAPTGVYGTAVRRVRALAGRLAGRFPNVVIGGDWNRPFRDRPRLPGFTAAGAGVDYTYTRRPAHIAGSRVLRHTYSDHNGVRVWVRNG